MDIITACTDRKLFRPYLEDSKNGITLRAWGNWSVALQCLFGLPIKRQKSTQLVKQCTGRSVIPTNAFRTALFLVGRRGGKSKIAGLIAAFMAALSGLEGKLSKGEMGLISVISPSKLQSQIIKKYIRAAFASEMLEAEIVDDGDKKDYFVLSNGVMIKILTGDYRLVRGFTQLAVIIDEVCFFGTTEESKVRNDTELIQAIKPALLTTKGPLIAISTKYARKGWAYNCWKKNFGNDKSRILVWDAPSLLMNSATLSQEDIDDEIAEDPILARTEYLNEWRDDVCIFIPAEVVDSVVVKGRSELMFHSKINYAGFVDVSGGRSDSATIAIAHKDTDKIVMDFMKEYRAPFNPQTVIADMADNLRRFKLNSVVGDNYSAEFVAQEFQRNGISYNKSQKNKNELYLELLPRLCSGQIELLDHPRANSQLANLERRTRSGGKDSIDHPVNGKDDLANVIAGVSDAFSNSIRLGAW